MAKCNPVYKNLNEIQSFSEQRYATVQLMEQACMNDEYLKQEVDELGYLTPPRVRKRFTPILLDEQNSWGCELGNGVVDFSNQTEKSITIDFNDMTLIDENKTDVFFETIPDTEEIDDDEYIVVGQTKRAVIPFVNESTVKTDCRTSQTGNCNSAWYVGYDHAKTYRLQPDWIKNWFDAEIPSIVRAQTFTIPAGNSGYLESIDLKIENTGGRGSWASPLIVQIWRTKVQRREYRGWDKKKKRSYSFNPKIYRKIQVPYGSRYTPLAQCIYEPYNTEPVWHNFKFDKPVKVSPGEHYAFVVFSPLSHKDHCPRLGGWGRNCTQFKYDGGNAFLSENNSRHFYRFGRNEENVDYKFGQYEPQDFAFQCHIRQYTQQRIANEEFYVYLKPIRCNPTTRVEINATNSAGTVHTGDLLRFQVSRDGKTWHNLDANHGVNFSSSGSVDYPTIIFVRAIMKTTSTTISDTPYINKFNVNLTMLPSKEFYARTHYYHPKISPMLGASLWGKIFAPFEADAGVTGSVEIIKEETVKETFKIMSAEELNELTYVNDEGELTPTIEGLDADYLADESLDVRAQYLVDTPNAIELLRENNIYVKPYTFNEGEEDETKEMLSFNKGIQLTNSPAYPIVEVVARPDEGDVISYSEWVDYTFDYDTDNLNFYNEDADDEDYDNHVVDGLPIGALTITYNPVFIQDLTNAEVGVRENDEGLILDYFKETFKVTAEMVKTGIIPLRVAPVDPLREVQLNELELREDIHFTVDYINKNLIFETATEQTDSLIHENDELSIVYTPNLEDTGIALGYRAKRSNLDKSMKIKNNYIEYKV